CSQQREQSGALTPLTAIRREILGDEVEFSYPLGCQSLGLGNQRIDRSALLQPSDLRNDTERALVITAFGHLEVSCVKGGGNDTGSRVIRKNVRGTNISRRTSEECALLLDDFSDTDKLSRANEDIDFG